MQVQNHAYLYKSFNNICINTKNICILCINSELLCKKGEKEMRLRKGGQIMNDIGRMKNMNQPLQIGRTCHHR